MRKNKYNIIKKSPLQDFRFKIRYFQLLDFVIIHGKEQRINSYKKAQAKMRALQKLSAYRHLLFILTKWFFLFPCTRPRSIGIHLAT